MTTLLLSIALLIPPGKPLPIEPAPARIEVGHRMAINCGYWQDGEHIVYRGLGRAVAVDGFFVTVETCDGLWICLPSECRRILP